MTSFQRQLNLYGFMRKTDGSDRGSYYHELFLRGRPDLAKIMVRTRVKGDNTKSRKVMAEPDFFKMPFCPEDPDPRQHERGAPRGSRAYYNPESLRSPRGGYSAAPYYPASSSGGAYRRREPVEGRRAPPAPTVAEVTPSTPKSEYISGPPMALPSSSFFSDDHEPPMHAPENSMWTPPPFPAYETRHHHPRERPRYQVLQASPRSAYPAVVSPNSMDHPPPLAPVRYSTPTRSSSTSRPYHHSSAAGHHYSTSAHYSRRGPPPPRISPSSRLHVYGTDRARTHHIMRARSHQEREDIHMHHYEREMRERTSHRRVMPPPPEHHVSPRRPPESPHHHHQHHHQVPRHHSPRSTHSSGASRVSASSSTPTDTDRKRRREWADPAVDGDLVIPYDHKSSSDLPSRPTQRLMRRRSSGAVSSGSFFDADDFEPIDDTSLEFLESSLNLAPV